MAIITETYYNDTFMGEPVATSDFPRYNTAAQRAVLYLINMQEADVSDLSETNQAAVKDAICAQLQYIGLNGFAVTSEGKTEGGFTVGKVSVSGDSSKSGAASMISPEVYMLLERTGLIGPQVATADAPLLWGYY